jgi:hypothetical protein
MLQHVDTVLGFAVVMLLLSLLVTTLVQAVIAVFGLRGVVLQWGIERLLRQLDPKLKDYAEEIAEAVVRHPAVCNVGQWRATSIRREELVRLLDALAQKGTLPAPSGRIKGSAAWVWMVRRAQRVLRFFGVRKDVSALSGEARVALKQVLGTPAAAELTQAAEDLKTDLERRFKDKADMLREAVDTTMAKTRKVSAEIGAWFDTVMDRTTELFIAQTRMITVVLALILAFVFHIDSLVMLKQLASDPELRAEMVQNAEMALKKGKEVFALTALEKTLASEALEQALAKVKDEVADPNALPEVPDGLVRRGRGRAWLETKMSGSADREKVLAAYDTTFDDLTKKWLGDLNQSAQEIKASLQKSKLVIVPSPFPGWPEWIWRYVQEPMHFWGVLMTALLLSLGAPFWYNVLRQVSDLRPVLAEKIDPKARAKK